MTRTLTVLIEIEHSLGNEPFTNDFTAAAEDHVTDKLLGTSFFVRDDEYQVTDVSVETVEDPDE